MRRVSLVPTILMPMLTSADLFRAKAEGHCLKAEHQPGIDS